MTAEINEFDAGEEAYTPELSGSFCGTPKSKAFGGFLVNGLNVNICPVCIDKIRKALSPEPEETTDGAA